MAAFCSNCGSPVEGRFCPQCGAAVPQVVSGGEVPPQLGASAPPMTGNVAAALCYVLGFVTGILFLILPPYNRDPLVRFHAFQSIFLHVAVFAAYIVAGFVFGVLRIFGVFFLWPLIGLAGFALWIYMIVSAYQGKHVVLPFVGPLAAQQAGAR